MRVAVTKENGAFAIEASEIKTNGDVQEVIRQLQLVEGQMVDGLEGKGFFGNCHLKGQLKLIRARAN